ncbi:C40 family peptidase [Arthrobacter sp. 260]|uniref:C40 family peptidase n=1 Tax=Arthrobacter sp. 260 TaxID=2735314 RepID=UPI0014919BFE|nr:C40 family peptidase [Arthrobacter sp. 260]NOJ60488.1 C40 family peptidase [Arthrobacter sp. 260]
MTIVDTVGRIQQIQSTLTRLSTPVAAAATTPAPATTSTSSSSSASTGSEGPTRAFADALAAAAAGTPPAASVPATVSTAAVAPAQPMATGEATSSDVVAAANRYVGVPYVWGGTDPAVGMDCSGFTQRVYRDLGIELPRVTWDQMKMGTEVSSLAEAQPGDLLFSLDGGHVSIYLGNNKVIDAPQPGQNIAVRDAWENDGNLDSIRRIVPTDSEASEMSALTEGAAANGAALADLVAAAQAAFVSGRP